MAATPESLSNPHFGATLARHGIRALIRKSPATIQVNVGKLCNQACHHCHVDAGPRRTERMTRATAERVIDLLAASPRRRDPRYHRRRAGAERELRDDRRAGATRSAAR